MSDHHFLSASETTRYSRHILLPEIGEEGQLKLKQARVLVVGAGGLGSPVLQYLTAAGVGTIGIVDHDAIQISNLQRQILYTASDINKPKAQTAASRLKQLNPHVHFNIYDQQLNKANALALITD